MDKRHDWKALSAVLTAEQLDGLSEDWQAFVERTGTEDRDLFVQYLHQQGLIGEEQLSAALRIRIRPELSDIHAMDRRARGEEEAARTYATMSPAGHYALLGRIGHGAMGEIWVGKDHDLKRKVAYKQLSEKFRREAAIRQRFLHEAQITAQLDHPGVVPVYGLEAGSAGRLGYAMKLVEGRDLRALIDSGAAETRLTDRLELFLKICDAVAYAHSRGVLHRDLKPENVMVGRFGEVYVMDWGLARLAGQREQDGHAVGTPAYMSPEQARGQNEQLDARSDQYTLGLVLQEIVTLESPLATATTAEAALVAASQAHRRPMVGPRALCAIVARACARRPEDRYADVSALAADIRAYLRDDPVDALREGPVRKVWRGLVRYRELVLLVGIAFVIAGALVAVGSVGAISVGALAQQQREEKLGQAIAAIGEQAHRIDKEVLRYERTLEVFAGAAGHLMAHAVPAENVPIYLAADFDDPASRPGDTAVSPRYGREVSLTAPVFKLAPDVERAEVDEVLSRLVRLSHDLRRVVVAEEGEDTPPIGWMFVGTESGVHMSFPGHGGYQPGFDPRRRPWYEQARDRRGPVWGNPYVDEGGLGLVVPCSRSLRASDGRLLGVAGIDVTLGHLIDEMLAPPALPISQAWLLDGDGKVVVTSGDRELPDAGVAGAVREMRPASLRQQDGSWLLVFPLHALGWAYVVEASEAALIGR